MLVQTATALAEHHHRAVIVMFFVGYTMFALGQIDAIARAHPVPQNSRINLIKSNWIPLMVRAFVSLIIFEVIAHNQAAAVTRIEKSFNLSTDSLVVALIALPIVPMTAAAWGFAIDAALTFIPSKWIKTVVPPPPAPEPAAAPPAQQTKQAP